VFVIIPYKSDADTREFPWGTVALVGLNFAVALLLGFASPAGGETVDKFILEFGAFNPLTWVSSAFVHFGWLHLVSNMVFLWAFGFIVEGYLGAGRFLAFYCAVVGAAGCVTQAFMLGADGGGAAGASGGVFALMAAAALRAPRNRLTVFLWIVIFFRKDAEMTVLGFCMFWIGLDLLFLFLFGFPMSSELLHMLGAACGLAGGYMALHNDWIDTGGWDYLALRKHGEPRFRLHANPGEQVDPEVKVLVAVRDALDRGDALGAEAAYAHAPAGFRLPPEDLERLVDGLRAQGRADLAVPRLEERLEREPNDRNRLELAEQLIEAGRPTRALEHLESVAAGDARRELEGRARRERDKGGLELE